MHFVTAANRRFRPIVIEQATRLTQLGYRNHHVYDLGGLGFGIPAHVDDEHFQAHGHYGDKPGANWTTTARHKPEVVKHCRDRVAGHLLYIDADAIVHKHVDELDRADCDVVIAARSEAQRVGHYRGEFNAGVIGFGDTPAARELIGRWSDACELIGNDQQAINKLLNPGDRTIRAGEDFTINGLRVGVIDGGVYNTADRVQRTKVTHYCRESWREMLNMEYLFSVARMHNHRRRPRAVRQRVVVLR